MAAERVVSYRATRGARSRSYLRTGLIYLLLILGGVTMAIPFLWMLSTSLKAQQFVLVVPPEIIPKAPTLDSYRQLAELFPIWRLLGNSVVVAACVTLGQLLTAAMAAYAFARMTFRGRNVLFLLYLATLMIPSQVTITPLFILMRYLGWINTYQGLIAPGVFTAFGTFLLRQHFLSLPRELEEAAYIDGATPLHVFARIIIPLSGPALATLAVFSFMNSWNAFLWPLFVVRDTQLMTLPVGLASLHGRYLTQWNLVMGGAVLTVLPMLLVFLALQKYFVKGVVMSGLKG
jgi:multiple sugar transport system permease protein